MAPSLVQFTPLSSLTNPSFWNELTRLKLDVLKLSDAEVNIRGSYGVGRQVHDREGGKWIGIDSSLTVQEESFKEETLKLTAGSVETKGFVKNFNTIEDFKAADKTKIFNERADKIWTSIVESRSTELLNSFFIIAYADLKKYKYYYWFAFPAFVASPAWHILDEGWVSATTNASFTDAQLRQIHTQISSQPLPYFLVVGDKVQSLETLDSVGSASVVLGFVDPSSQAQNPGWPLRNLLAYIKALYPHLLANGLKVLCWRDVDVPKEGEEWKSRFGTLILGDSAGAPASSDATRPNAVGWEKNPQGKLGPRMADLGGMMDPTRLASQATQLNLKLMRWRILPSLDLDRISEQKCLLLGAGTLGCYVARTLLAWGVTSISLVDYGRVSYSNPVRQPLFTFEDCLNGGQPKAPCAAKRLKEISPSVDAKGYTLSIPMPGHPIPATPPSLQEDAKRDVEKLESLIDEADVVFLLTDSRESRWLPGVLARKKGKLVINAALGFDTFLVMRYGARPKSNEELPRHKNLGCYFCNDIVAPADSLTDRTLDEMCTVTRPGLASIAASTAVELMMSVVQHPEGIYAPAPPPPSNDTRGTTDGSADQEAEGSSVLGLVPHQLRGYLAQFRNLHVVGRAYDRCTGCSESVLEAYEAEGFPMLLKAFNEPKYLEQLTGLDKLFAEGEAAAAAMESVDWEEEEDDF